MWNLFTKDHKEENESLSLGEMGEKFAQEEYRKRGYEIVAANEFNRRGKRLGEIDFIAKNKDSLAFVEVKTRSKIQGKFGTAVESVNFAKQRKILKAVKLFLARHQEFTPLRPHIDVCALVSEGIDKPSFSVTILENVVDDWN